MEYQTSSEGAETDVPLAVEYGLTDRLELLVEPVFYTAIRPKMGTQATGVGDLEVTLSYLFLHEAGSHPAMAFAGEAKIPTARNSLIGTREPDYTPFLIISRHFGKLVAHANLGYTFVGQPPGPRLKNTINFAAALEYHVNGRWDIVGEFLGNTASLPSSEQDPTGTPNAVTPEAAGAERSFMVGGRYILRPGMYLSLGVSYDNNNALLLRPGFTFRF